MASIKVLAGDIDTGSWQFVGVFGSALITRASTTKHLFKGEKIDLKLEAASIEMLDEDKSKKLAGTAAWGFAGAVLLGPLGAIGGMLLGGNSKDVVLACELKAGRKFLAQADGSVWKKIFEAKG